MVLELKVPHGDTLDALLPEIPMFLSYVFRYHTEHKLVGYKVAR